MSAAILASASASEALNTGFVFSGFEMTSHTVYEIGVWGKVWLGTRTLRGGKFAVLQSIDAGGEEDYSRGWIEEWRLEETGEVLSFTRRSPSRDGWVLKALGNSNAECPIWGGGYSLEGGGGMDKGGGVKGGCFDEVGVGKRGNVGMVVVIEEGERQIQRETERHRETERDTERQRDKEIETERKNTRERHRDRKTERDKERNTERERQSERRGEREKKSLQRSREQREERKTESEREKQRDSEKVRERKKEREPR